MVTWSCIIYDEMWSLHCTDQIAIGLVLMFLLIIQPDKLMHCTWLEPQEPQFEFNSGQISEKFFNFSSRSREFLVWVNGEFELSRFYCTSNLNNDSWLWTDTTLLHEYGISNYCIKPSMHVCGIICHLINLDLPPLVVLLPFNNSWKWLPQECISGQTLGIQQKNNWFNFMSTILPQWMKSLGQKNSFLSLCGSPKNIVNCLLFSHNILFNKTLINNKDL